MHVELGQFVFKKSVLLEHPSVYLHDVFGLFWRSVELLKFHGWNQLSSVAAAHVNWDHLEKSFWQFQRKTKKVQRKDEKVSEKSKNKFQRKAKKFQKKAKINFREKQKKRFQRKAKKVLKKSKLEIYAKLIAPSF